MKTLIRLEDIVKLLIAFGASIYLGYAWWVFPAWLLAPDLSMLGYLLNTKIGAWTYNIFHHQGLALAFVAAGVVMAVPELQLAGLVLFGHSAMDRALGYGLKYEDSFQHTHLGWIGKKQQVSVPKV
ncbi:DUF4260 domain-containing protein [Cesiribacter sp. SM1]|uniref:DUF4260 domain-containing protein n=1 Tax=Cesiribacter sp. SM1 TaxID=2861196 RepID=UPI001CD552A9|nr:DUF4260 domain-containing protein [Cesiribacter sp. SM1]